MKTFYSDYVSHAMRFYIRNQEPPITAPLSDRKSWLACDNVVKSLSDAERHLIRRVYSSKLGVKEAVCLISRTHGDSIDEMWATIKKVERKVAEERGLV